MQQRDRTRADVLEFDMATLNFFGANTTLYQYMVEFPTFQVFFGHEKRTI